MKSDETHLLRALCTIRSPEEMRRVLAEILTPAEYRALLKRWAILRLLRDGIPQREIAQYIGGSLCNVTRGARLMNQPDCASDILMTRMENKRRRQRRPKSTG
ncbi:MAG TPA: Trp family transcriptional regulator [Kiritimatiellia bacterium]|jgi:TrpR family trp operon transcriptional repressor|nr:transcriptional regulator [Lentisphaerota bacterium]HRV31863.1 Trp family transcriptional regulator [Kiritimatiellia bacterium]